MKTLVALIACLLLASPAFAADWAAQAIADAKLDRTSIPYDGKTPDKMVCDTTLRALPDGSWALFMLAGDDLEPSPKNYTGTTRSNDEGKTWSPLKPMETGLPRTDLTTGQCVSEVMVRGGRVTAFLSTHSQTWGRDWQPWILHSDDSCRTWSKPEPHNPNPSHRSAMALWISFDGLKTWPYRRVLVPESCDGPKGRMNYPDGFVSKDKQWLNFAFDDNLRARHAGDVAAILARRAVLRFVRRVARLDDQRDRVADHRPHLRHEVARLLDVDTFARVVMLRDLFPAVVDRRRIPAFELEQFSEGEYLFGVHLFKFGGKGGSFAL